MRASVSGGIKAPSARDGFEAGQPWAVFHIVSRRSRNSLAGQNLLQGVPNGARSTSRGRRRVVAKAEWTQGEANPRFVVTSLKRSEAGARHLYEDISCARGDKSPPAPLVPRFSSPPADPPIPVANQLAL
jgi:hypothetical protein